MALTFDNCLLQSSSGDSNAMYADCCWDVQCIVTTDIAVTIDDITSFFSMESFYLRSPLEVYIGGILQSFPLSLNANDSFELKMSICAPSAGNSDTLSLDFLMGGAGSQQFEFAFDSIDLSSTFDISSINFGNIAIGSSVSYPIVVNNPTINCHFWELFSSCTDFSISETSITLCHDDSTTIYVNWTPTATGLMNCDIAFETRCYNYTIPITGNAIEPPTGGNTAPQKNKVDQTTRVESCSPRAANNRCQTARTMQSAIRTNARRFGKR